MPIVRACAVGNFDPATQTCAVEVWIDQPGLIPPLPVEQGLEVSGGMFGVCALAWSFKAVRRFINPKMG